MDNTITTGKFVAISYSITDKLSCEIIEQIDTPITCV